jgi:hypothetical protein
VSIVKLAKDEAFPSFLVCRRVAKRRLVASLPQAGSTDQRKADGGLKTNHLKDTVSS